MDEQQPCVPPAAGQSFYMEKNSIVGGPVTSVLFLPGGFHNEEFVLMTRGPHLECFSLRHKHVSSSFRPFKGGTIHGIETHCLDESDNESTSSGKCLLAVAYGGKQLALFYILQSRDEGGRTTHVSFDAIPLKIKNKMQSTLQVSDWIWNVKLLNSNNCFNLVVAMAHNMCDQWCLISSVKKSWKAMRLKRIVCNTRCITYSMCLFMDIHDSLKVASGTVMNEILVWGVYEEKVDNVLQAQNVVTTIRRDVQHVLRGHEGVIHSVQVTNNGEYIASTSDDRTVRLWKLVDEQYILYWTGWNGHTARVWDSAFCNHTVVTAGEDGMAIVWDLQSGIKLGELRGGHANKSIWTVAASSNTKQDMIVTGGNNGTAQVWNLSRRIVMDTDADAETQTKSDSRRSVLVVPKDESSPGVGADENNVVNAENGNNDDISSKEEGCNIEAAVTESGNSGAKKKKKKKKQKRVGQVVFGIQFYKVSSDASPLHHRLLVATRAGSLLSYCLYSKEWSRFEAWWAKTDSHASKYSSTDGSCMAVHDSGNLVAIGTTRGYIVLVPLCQRLDNYENTEKPKRTISLLSSPHGKSVQGVDWVDDSMLIAYYIKGAVILWKRVSPSIASDREHGMVLHRVLFMETVGIPMCFARLDDCLFIGDSRGNIAAFQLGSDDDSKTEIHPTDIATRVHKKEHVTDMIVLWDKQLLVSVGNDGCMHECIIDASSGKLHKALSLPTASLSGISRIWLTTSGTPVVGGYYGNHFAVVDVTTGTELFRVDTGGRQRQQDCFADMAHMSSFAYGVAICTSLKDGGNEVILQSSTMDNGDAPIDMLRLECSTGIGLHGETIFDACWCPTPNGLLVLSGSEDCTTRLSCYKGGKIVHSKFLQPHESCVRAVCCSKGTHSTLLVTCGGKLTIQFFVVQHHEDFSQSNHLPVWFLGNGRFSSKPSIDHRINAVKATRLRSSSATDTHLVVTGDSNGVISLFLVMVGDNVVRQSPNTGRVLYTATRPVLSLDIICFGEWLLVLAGTTGGEVLMWKLPTHQDDLSLNEASPTDPLTTYKAHTMGTNSISAVIVGTDNGCTNVLICTGGDDQAIALCRARFCVNKDLESTSALEIAYTSVTREASASAIKGVCLIGGDFILSVGYSQRLALWKSESYEGTLRLVAIVPVDVSDVNCLAFCSTSQQYDKEETRSGVVAVGGEGLEFFTMLDGGVDSALTKEAGWHM